MQVADARPRAQADARADRRQDHVARLLIIDPQTGDHVETAVDARIALEQSFRVVQVVDQGEDLRRVAVEIESDGQALPIDLLGRA